VSNQTGRFERLAYEAEDDGWGAADEPAPHLETTLMRDSTRSVIVPQNSPDISFQQSLNTYRGCEHGCIYCFARPSHTYLGLSAGLDFESKILFKPDAAALLEKELASPRYQVKPLAIGANTDVYQPVERKLKITRAVLEVCARWSQPIALITKSQLIMRDLDILGPMAKRRLAKVAVSVTTLDRKLARVMEPRAATPQRRLDAIRALSEAGVPVTVMAAPMIPALTDHELEAILEAAADAGAVSAGYVTLRLPHEIADLFQEWLHTHQPDRAAHVLSQIRQMRGGKLYDATWSKRMTGAGPLAHLLARRFQRACAEFGLNERSFPFDLSQFKRPPGMVGPGGQLNLF
jgi:DNA repair photolyase